MTNELNHGLENALIECLEAIENGAGLEDCLARYPQLAQELRPNLELRTQMLALELPAPSPAEYEQGRQALLGRLAGEQAKQVQPPLVVQGVRWRLDNLLSRFGLNGLATPMSRAAAAVGALFLLGGAIGASAAVGFEPSRDVLSALHIVDKDDGGDEHAEGPQDPPKSDDNKDAAAEPTKDDENDNAKATPTPAQTKQTDQSPSAFDKTPTPRDNNDAKPTATQKRRDSEPSDRRPTKTPTPRRIVRPTNTPNHEEPTKTPEEPKPTKTPEPPKPTKTATPTKKPDEPL